MQHNDHVKPTAFDNALREQEAKAESIVRYNTGNPCVIVHEWFNIPAHQIEVSYSTPDRYTLMVRTEDFPAELRTPDFSVNGDYLYCVVKREAVKFDQP